MKSSRSIQSTRSVLMAILGSTSWTMGIRKKMQPHKNSIKQELAAVCFPSKAVFLCLGAGSMALQNRWWNQEKNLIHFLALIWLVFCFQVFRAIQVSTGFNIPSGCVCVQARLAVVLGPQLFQGWKTWQARAPEQREFFHAEVQALKHRLQEVEKWTCWILFLVMCDAMFNWFAKIVVMNLASCVWAGDGLFGPLVVGEKSQGLV